MEVSLKLYQPNRKNMYSIGPGWLKWREDADVGFMLCSARIKSPKKFQNVFKKVGLD